MKYFRLLYILIILFLSAQYVAYPSSNMGSIRGIVQNEDGNPLVGAIISVFKGDWAGKSIMRLRTNRQGEFTTDKLPAGRYVLNIVKKGYKPLAYSILIPLKETPLLVKLQNILKGKSKGKNWDVSTVMRTPTDKKLIFRSMESKKRGRSVLKEGKKDSVPRNGFVEFSTTTPFGGLGYNVFPQPGGTGFTTRFAYVEPLGLNANYIVTGMISSGTDSQYQVKNILNLNPADGHKMVIQLDYKRMGATKYTMQSINKIDAKSIEDEILSTIKPIQNISFGIRDYFKIFEPLTMVYGFDINYVDAGKGTTFINPRFKLYFTPLDNLSFRFLLNSDRVTNDNTMKLGEGLIANLYTPLQINKIDGKSFITRLNHVETGLSFLLSERTNLEISAFIDDVAGSGYPFVAILKNPSGESINYPLIPDDKNDSKGLRFNLNHSWTNHISTSVLYIYGKGTDLSLKKGDEFSTQHMGSFLNRRFFNVFSSAFKADFPETGTDVVAEFRYSKENSLIPIDAYSDFYNVENNSLSVFIRQSIPLFETGLGKWEAILDIRNILNQGVKVFETPSGDLILVRYPRSFRGGISLRF